MTPQYAVGTVDDPAVQAKLGITAAPVQVLGGLFDLPLGSNTSASVVAQPLDVFGGSDGGPCPDGFEVDDQGDCVPPVEGYPGETGSVSVTNVSEPVTVNTAVNNAVNITDTGIQQVSDAVSSAVTSAAQQASQIAQQTSQEITDELGNSISAITGGIQNAATNIAQTVANTATGLWQQVVSIVSTIGSGISTLITDVKNFLSPILNSITATVTAINTQVQAINDTLIKPIATLYTSTIGTIATLTTAIEKDLHDGLTGLLQIPTDLANAFGSLDSTLQRTVQQLGTTNAATVNSGITFAAGALPDPFGVAMNKALAGSTLPNSIKTTFGNTENLSSETLQQVSAEAISAMGGLLQDMLNITASTFKSSFDNLHTDWASVGGVFVGLLDGILSLITTVTALGAIVEPLIDAAGQSARTLVPVRKLDPATAVEAMRRQFISAEQGMAEIATAGLDPTRSQVLVNLGVFLADINTALDWWYRGIIADTDLAANLSANGLTANDQAALQAGSVFLPAISDFIRWMNFGIISQDEFTTNCKILRYTDAQIQAVLSSYQQRETPEILSSLNGLLNNSTIGYLNGTLGQQVPTTISTAGQRSNYHPDLVQYLWLAHWQIPSVQVFIQNYFRGIRTLTELQARMAIDNIPQELYDDVIESVRPLIPYRSIPSFVKNGWMTNDQATKELAAHGYDTAHQQIILASVAPVTAKTNATAAATVHTLSQTNARELWGEGAITDDQYTAILEAHGYTADMSALQLKADAITVHIKTQKQAIADATAEVEAGVVTLEDASNSLLTQGLTQAQVSSFQIKVSKALAVATKHPSLSELKTFVTAQLITLDQYKMELQVQGWNDPWLSAFVSLLTPPPNSSTTTP